jgi:hypothetical protein
MMKKLIQMIFLVTMSLFLFTACSSGLDPDTFSTEVSVQDDSNWWSGYRTVAVLTIRSNVGEEIQVDNVTINNGQCEYQPISFPRYFKMGQTLRLKLKCGIDNVVRVDIETPKGNAQYSF